MFLLTAVAASAMLYSGCAKPEISDGNQTGNLVTVHFGTENVDPSTKATLTPNEGETAFQAAWENEDAIKIEYSNDSKSETVTRTGTTTAIWNGKSFESKMPEYTGMWIYDAAYPVPSESDNSVDFGSNRTQKGNAYNSKYDIMIGSAVAENAAAGKDDSGKDIVFQMTRQTAIAYFHFTSALDEAVTSATLKVTDGAIANSSASINEQFKFVAPQENDLTEINLTFEEGTAPSAKDFQLWFNVLPTTYNVMTLTVETASKSFTIKKDTKGELDMYEAGKLYKVKKSGIAWTDKGGSVTPSSVTDVITADKLKATGTSYTDFSGVTISSEAVYAGNNAKNSNGAIQLRSDKSVTGIVSTTSGGKVTKVSVEWGSGTANGRIIDVYGNTNPYTSASELYSTTSNTNQGTKIGTIVYGTSTELVIDGNYPYIGIRSNSGALYLNSVSITWESGSSEPAPDTYTVSCETVTGGTLSATPSKAEAGAEVTLTATPDAEYTFNNDWAVTNAESSEVITVKDGKFTMPAANVNVSASFTQKTYTITANTAENGTYTVKVGDAEVTSAVKGAKVLLEATPAEGYICDGWTVLDAEGNSVTVTNNYFYMPASAVTISTSFSLKPEDITYDHAGTAEDPYSVADVLKYISTLGTATSTEDVYVKGIISSISEVSTSYGNATYFIKDEGIENEVKVFRGLYLNGAKFTSADQIGVGDKVVVVGKVLDYNGTPEVNSGNKIVSIIKAPYLKATASKETGIAAAGETVTITVDTNVDSWKATSNNADFAVGTPSGNTVDVVVSKNTDASERTATITVTAGTLSKTITLTQSAAGTTSKEPVVIILDAKDLSSTATTADSEVSAGKVRFVLSKGAKSQSSTSATNAFSDNASILIGKSGAYIYNKTAIPGVITKFEIYANAGASTKVSVGVNFSNTSISSYSATAANTYTATLSTLNKVYDCSDKLPSDAKYFWYQVTNANNSQVQFRITYIPE